MQVTLSRTVKFNGTDRFRGQTIDVSPSMAELLASRGIGKVTGGETRIDRMRDRQNRLRAACTPLRR